MYTILAFLSAIGLTKETNICDLVHASRDHTALPKQDLPVSPYRIACMIVPLHKTSKCDAHPHPSVKVTAIPQLRVLLYMLAKMGSALKGKNLLCEEQILSCKSWTIFRKKVKMAKLLKMKGQLQRPVARSGPSCSKLTMLVNVSLQFGRLISEICHYFML